MEALLVIENDPDDPLGNLGDAIDARGLSTRVVRPPSGDAIPAPADFAALVILGGPQGAYESDLHPYLEDEMDAIRAAVDADVPVLGICLGSQLIAHALGGRSYRAAHPEADVIEPRLTPEGRGDPLAHALGRPVLTFHQDTFDVPPHATVLATSDAYPQVFRCGSALAIQPHPEIVADHVALWMEESDIPRRAGTDAHELLEKIRTQVDRRDAMGLFDAWLDEISD